MTLGERVPVRVLLVDDHPVVRGGLRLLLSQGEEIAIVGEAETGREAIRLADELAPDVAVVDLGLPDISGLDVTRAIRDRLPSTRILIVTMHDEDEYVLGVLEAGADGYLLKQSSGDELRNAVLRIHAGERVLHPRALQALIARATHRPEPPIEALSEREREVLQLLADGGTSKEIAAALGLRPKTVENHRARILDKLGVTNSAAAVRTAVGRGLIRPTAGHFAG